MGYDFGSEGVKMARDEESDLTDEGIDLFKRAYSDPSSLTPQEESLFYLVHEYEECGDISYVKSLVLVTTGLLNPRALERSQLKSILWKAWCEILPTRGKVVWDE